MSIRTIIPKPKIQTTIVFNTTLFSNEDKLILAPMQNLTSLFFRKTHFQLFPGDIDYAIAPFISSSNGKMFLSSKNHKLPAPFYDITPQENNALIPVIPQILGNDPTEILECAKIIQSLGYRQVNLNMGCPKKDIVSHKRGAGLLKEKDILYKIIDTILKNTTLNLSLKVRLGINSCEDLENLIDILNSFTLQAVCIHPRTQIQQYQGQVDLQAFEYFASKLKHTIIYNGDIFSVSDFTRLKSRFPYIKHWMIGRGVLRNPFLFSQIRSINHDSETMLPIYLHLLQENFAQSLKHYNEITILNKMKEFIKYLSAGYGFDASESLRRQTLKDFMDTLFSLFPIK